VAFSDGSLPFGFLQRIAKRQPLSAPNDVRRYFISHQEAGELCVLSCGLGDNRDVFFPNLAQGLDEKTLPTLPAICSPSSATCPWSVPARTRRRR